MVGRNTGTAVMMRNLLQDKLLKAGLAKKSQVDQAARELAKQKQGKAPPPAAAAEAAEVPIDAQALAAEKAARDRARAAEQNALKHQQELRAQVKQIVETQAEPKRGELPYRFTDGATIKSLFVDARQREMLAVGTLLVVRHGPEDYVLLKREAAEKVRSRDAAAIVVDHGAATAVAAAATPEPDSDEAFYARFQVPDDLSW